LIWFNSKEKVIDLSPVSDNIFFFLTATDYGKKGVFPFVNNIKIYLFTGEEFVLLKEAGNGVQAYAQRVNNNYKVTVNDIDKTVAGYIEQNIIVFNEAGKLLLDEEIRYDLANEGFPQPEKKEILFASPSGRYKMSEEGGILLSKNNEERILISEVTQPVTGVEWVNDQFVIVRTTDVSADNETLYDKNPETSTLIIYSLNEGKVIQEFRGGGYKNYLLKGNIIIFDDGFRGDSDIKIFDYKKGEMIEGIKKDGGTGINRIPEPPDYSA
jgi:hypothetical protein